MSNNRENFQYTGGSVPIDQTYAHAQVINFLDEYNYQLEHDIVPDVNPFNEKLIAKSQDGKFYETHDHSMLFIKAGVKFICGLQKNEREE